MKNFLARHQISFFFLLAFAFSWFPWYAGLAPEVMALGPSLAAFLLVLLIDRGGGLLDLLRPFGRFRAGLAWWGLALFGPAVLYLLGLGVHLLLGGEPPPFTMIRSEFNLIPLYLVLVVLSPLNGPVGEEFGWRGFALPRLQSKYGPLAASLAIGALWGIWHLPSFFSPVGVISAMVSAVGLVFLIPYTLGTIANSIIMTWLYNKTNRSALIAGIAWHAAINFWAPVLLSDSSLVAAREGTHLPTIAPTLYLIVLAVQVAAAGTLAFATRGKLGYTLAGSREKFTRQVLSSGRQAAN